MQETLTPDSPAPSHVKVAWVVDVEAHELPNGGDSATYADVALAAYDKIVGHQINPVLEVASATGNAVVDVDTETVLAYREQGA